MRGPWDGDWPQSAGWRYSSGNPHFSLDIATPTGVELYAPGDGVIIDRVTGVTSNGYGQSGAPSNWIIVRFKAPSGPYKGQQQILYYQHLKSVKVKPGEKVKRGQLLGISNNTGNSSGPHTHFTLLKPGHSMTRDTRYNYLNNPSMVAWPIPECWDAAPPIDVYLGKLRPGQKNSASVRFLRKCLISRGLLVPKKGLSVDKPGNDYTGPTEKAVALWQQRHGHKPDGTLNMAQAQEFFRKNTRVRLHRPT